MTSVVVIGAGLNGLTCAALLARRKMEVTLVDARDRVGGIASPQAFHPGFTSAGLLHDTTGIRPRVISTLSLEQHGLRLRARRPDIAALGEGGEMLLIPGGDAEPTVRKHLGAHADGYLRYRAALDAHHGVLAAFIDERPLDVINLESLPKLQVAWRGLRIRRLGRREMMELLRLPPMSVADFLGEYIDSELLRAALAMPAVAGSFLGPHSPGSTANLLLNEAAAGPGVHGGGAAIAAALERAAGAAGVRIRTSARVDRLVTEGGKVTGVELAKGGERIRADIVVASCHPRTVFLDLLPPGATAFRLRERIASFRSRGTTAQVLLAVDRKIELPGGAEIARTGAHVNAIERAFDQAKHRRFPDAPVVEITVPSNASPDLAPAGSSVVSVLCHFAAYGVDGGWTDEARERFGGRVVEIVERHVPDVAGHVVGKQVMVPPDLEAEYGLVGGNVHHGEHALDQLLVRPIPECTGYRTPIPGLMLCGSGSHPGGGLTCAPGLLAADEILSR